MAAPGYRVPFWAGAHALEQHGGGTGWALCEKFPTGHVKWATFTVRELYLHREREGLDGGERGREGDWRGASIMEEIAKLRLSGLLSALPGFGPQNWHSRSHLELSQAERRRIGLRPQDGGRTQWRSVLGPRPAPAEEGDPDPVFPTPTYHRKYPV